MLYNMCHVILYSISPFVLENMWHELYNMCDVVLYNISYVMLCYITCVILLCYTCVMLCYIR